MNETIQERAALVTGSILDSLGINMGLVANLLQMAHTFKRLPEMPAFGPLKAVNEARKLAQNLPDDFKEINLSYLVEKLSDDAILRFCHMANEYTRWVEFGGETSEIEATATNENALPAEH